MKIVIAGKNEIAIEISKTLRELNTDTLIHYFCESEQTETLPFQNFAKYAREVNQSEGVKYRCLPGKGSGRILQELVENDAPDLFLSCQLSVIVNAKTCDLMQDRLLNFHFGPLPHYRGASPISHAILRGEPRHGTTLHLIDAGIDTGPVVDIEYFDARSLSNLDAYRACTHAGAYLLSKHIGAIRSAILERRTLSHLTKNQNDGEARYFSRYALDYRNNHVNADSSAADVDRFVRAFTFPPLTYAKLNINGVSYSIQNAKPLFGERCFGAKPGEVQIQSPTLARLATRDCWVQLWFIEDASASKLT